MLRADSIAVVTAVTASARCAWNVSLPAVGYALLFLGSWVPSLAVSFLLISRCRCVESDAVDMTCLSEMA